MLSKIKQALLYYATVQRMRVQLEGFGVSRIDTIRIRRVAQNIAQHTTASARACTLAALEVALYDAARGATVCPPLDVRDWAYRLYVALYMPHMVVEGFDITSLVDRLTVKQHIINTKQDDWFKWAEEAWSNDRSR